MSKPFNINEPVWVKVTARGWDVHDAKWRSFLADLPPTASLPRTLRPADRDDWQEFQLWDLMATFGHEMYVGARPLFEGNAIHLKKPKLSAARATSTGSRSEGGH